MRLSGGQVRATARPQRGHRRPLSPNGNGYEAGLEQASWKPMQNYCKEPNSETEEGVGQALTLQATRWQHVHGLSDPGVVSPGTVDSR
jgi:hypothetical protein